MVQGAEKMIIQIIEQVQVSDYNWVCKDPIARLKVTKANRDLLTTLQKDSDVLLFGKEYNIVRTKTIFKCLDTELVDDAYNVYVRRSYCSEPNYLL